jgi:LmbE family N-acetylglucosaminyl deacetylase
MPVRPFPAPGENEWLVDDVAWPSVRTRIEVDSTVTGGERRVAALALMQHRRVLAVVAHPDDESFGLGAVLSVFTESHRTAAVLCFTHGEGSTLGQDAGDLHTVRARELAAAAQELGVEAVRLLGYPDGRLADVDLDALRDDVTAAIDDVAADVLLVFDEGGVSGHPDHLRATEAAVAAAGTRGLPVVAWSLPESVARTLNSEFGTAFRGRTSAELGSTLTVDRARQRRAIARHRSQSAHNPVLWRRLALQDEHEWVRSLEVPGP